MPEPLTVQEIKRARFDTKSVGHLGSRQNVRVSDRVERHLLASIEENYKSPASRFLVFELVADAHFKWILGIDITLISS